MYSIKTQSRPNELHSAQIQVDPDNILDPSTREKFHSILSEYDSVYNPQFSGYNKASGPFEAVVNMGPTQPPQRKGRVPQYNKDKLSELQDKFDQLEELGVFAKPENVGVCVEYLNP